MIIAYCRTCLPEKVVLGFGEKARDLRAPHNTHEWEEKNRFFPISYQDWQTVYVEGDDEQTKTNIITTFGNKFN